MAANASEAKSHSLAPVMAHQSGRRDRMDVGSLSSSDRSVIDLTSTGTAQVAISDEEE